MDTLVRGVGRLSGWDPVVRRRWVGARRRLAGGVVALGCLERLGEWVGCWPEAGRGRAREALAWEVVECAPELARSWLGDRVGEWETVWGEAAGRVLGWGGEGLGRWVSGGVGAYGEAAEVWGRLRGLGVWAEDLEEALVRGAPEQWRAFGSGCWEGVAQGPDAARAALGERCGRVLREGGWRRCEAVVAGLRACGVGVDREVARRVWGEVGEVSLRTADAVWLGVVTGAVSEGEVRRRLEGGRRSGRVHWEVALADALGGRGECVELERAWSGVWEGGVRLVGRVHELGAVLRCAERWEGAAARLGRVAEGLERLGSGWPASVRLRAVGVLARGVTGGSVGEGLAEAALEASEESGWGAEYALLEVARAGGAWRCGWWERVRRRADGLLAGGRRRGGGGVLRGLRALGEGVEGEEFREVWAELGSQPAWGDERVWVSWGLPWEARRVWWEGIDVGARVEVGVREAGELAGALGRVWAEVEGWQ